MPPEERVSDLLIIGGGPAGMSLACALADGPLQVTLVEQNSPEQRAGAGQKHYALALAYASTQILKALGLWDALRPVAAPVRRVRVSEAGGCGGVLLDAKLLDLPALAYVLDAARLGAALETRLRRAANVRWLRPARLRALRPCAGYMEVTLEGASGRELRRRTRLLLGADGVASRVRDLAGIPWREEASDRVAITTVLEPELPHEDCAHERFTSTGPLVILPLVGGRCAAILFVPRERARHFTGMSKGAFEALLRRRLGGRLGRLRECRERQAFPLAAGRSEVREIPRLLLLGNAALTIHPHGAQGFNLVLRDLWVLAGLLAEAAARGEDPGASWLGTRYLQLRRAEQRRTELFSRGLTALFYPRRPGWKVARNLGMNLFDLSPGARRFLMRRATGLRACPMPR